MRLGRMSPHAINLQLVRSVLRRFSLLRKRGRGKRTVSVRGIFRERKSKIAAATTTAGAGNSQSMRLLGSHEGEPFYRTGLHFLT